MVPSEYRLERVALGLVVLLDGERRRYGSRDEAASGFADSAGAHVEALLSGWVDLSAPHAQRHAAWLRREVSHTFLPRFLDAAWRLTAAERDGFGLGVWATPWGRVGLVVGSLVVLWFGLLRFERLPEIWPLTLLDLAVPFLPDGLRALHQRRYEVSLRELMHDLTRAQEAALSYTPVAESPDTSPRSRRKAARPVA
jgi:hypothetical protein